MPGVLFTICRTTAAPWKPAPITATLMGRPSASSRASALSTIIIGSVPNLPGWIGEPMLLQDHSVPQGIHALPKSVMTMAGELALSHQRTHGALLQHRLVILDQIQNFRFTGKEAAIYQPFTLGIASCRERVCQYVWISVGAVSL